MYQTYFGLKEKPFKLVPNPDYLYLSKQHEIALAHLTYAMDQGEGFVVITGEVGTGKTTLCRNFLERLDENSSSAYIFQPTLDSVELLTTICNEFGIRTGQDSLKQLLDVINAYLIQQNKDGRKVVLLIDEAQNLSIENLELVRMLSNLETTRSKLLQIILVGQPELSDKLDSYELRQLAQRISLTAHLSPLGFDETTNYIHHRVHIAAQRNLTLFTPAACRLIFKYSRGIPRMINIACDRALITAFSMERPKVTRAIAATAIQELTMRGRTPSHLPIKKILAWSLACLVVFGVASLCYLNRQQIVNLFVPNHSKANRVDSTRVNRDASFGEPGEATKTYKIDEPTPFIPPTPEPTSEPAIAPVTADPQLTPTNPHNAIQDTLALLDHQSSRFAALVHLLALWEQPHPNQAQLPSQVEDTGYFDIAAHQYGLRLHAIDSDWALVRRLNLPAIVALKKENSEELVYAALEKWDEKGILLKIEGAPFAIETNPESLMPFLKGNAYVFWKNILGFDALITEGAPAKAVHAVKTLLVNIGYDQIVDSPVFDPYTKQAILDFQKRHFLEPDGLIGPLTKILLIQKAQAVKYPHLRMDRETGRE